MFWVNKLIAALILPPTGPLLVALLGVAIIARAPKTGRLLAAGGILLLLLLSLPVVANLLTSLVADGRALTPAEGRNAQAIVVLGSGLRRDAPEYGGDTASTLTLERARYGAYLARARQLPVAASGGALRTDRSEAEVIAELMLKEFGVSVQWVESKSLNTRQNSQELAKILLPAGVTRVLLVTHAVDTRRARREMVAAGFEVTQAPTVIPRVEIDGIWDLLPTVAALRTSHLATYEMLGNLKATLDGLP